MLSQTIKSTRFLILGIILLGIITGCGGGSPLEPDIPGDTVAAKKVLAEFANACFVKDVESAIGLCLNPDIWRKTLEVNSEFLPVLTNALATAEETRIEDNCITYKVKISHPDNPSYVRENYIYVARIPGEKWRIEFEYPGIDVRIADRKGNSNVRSSEWDANSTHPNILSEYIMKYYCAKYSEDSEFVSALDSNEKNGFKQVKLGSRDEDFKPEHMIKALGHFYTPGTQDEPIEPGSIIFHPISWEFVSAGVVEWLLEVDKLPQLENLDGILNPNSFQQAVAQMKAATSEDENAKAFNTFGYTLHLLEDCSVPAHVRNDPHYGVEYHNTEITVGDYLELWTTDPPESFLVETDRLYNVILDTDRISRIGDSFPGNDLINAFYSEPQYLSYKEVEALFKYTAVMANRMCFSNNTVFKSQSLEIQTNRFPDFTFADLDSQPARFFGTPGVEILDSLKQLGIIANETDDYLIGRGNTLFDLWLVYWTWNNASYPSDTTIEELLRSSEGSYVSLTDQDDWDFYTDESPGVREQQWRLLFPLIVKTGAAYLHEFYLAVY